MSETPSPEQEFILVPKKKNVQVKLQIESSFKKDKIEKVMDTISTALGITDTYDLIPLEAEGLIDIYHDTDDLILYKERNSLRIRHIGKESKVTIKLGRVQKGGKFIRDGVSITCTQAELQSEINGNFVSLIKKYLPHVANKVLQPTIVVKNSRRYFEMRLKDQKQDEPVFRARLSLDVYNLVNARNGKSSDELFEFEVEALNEESSKHLSSLSSTIREVVPDLKPSYHSKYERGVKYFNLDKPEPMQWITDWPRSACYNWVMFILAIIALVLGGLAL